MGIEAISIRQQRSREVIRHLREEIPEPKCALIHDTPYQLLIATILSAQCTDERVNKVTPGLFAKAPDANAMSKLGLAKIKQLIKSINFFNNKAANILAASKILVKEYGGEVPQSLEELVKLPGVGRKTANVVLGNAFGVPSMVVDTHVMRLCNRLGLVNSMDPVEIEAQLEKVIEKSDWIDFSHLLILHGRKTCKALKPACENCAIQAYCPSKNLAARAWHKK